MAIKILLADDSLTIQKVVELTFSTAETQLMAVGSGDKAVQALDGFQPDIVLADVVMPGLTGYDVCEQVKKHPGGAFVPVVLLTGTFEPFDRARAERVGSDAIVTKPFDSHALDRLVKELVTTARAAREQAATAPIPTSGFAKPVAEAEPFAPEPPVDLGKTAVLTPLDLSEAIPAPFAQAASAAPVEESNYRTMAMRVPSFGEPPLGRHEAAPGIDVPPPPIPLVEEAAFEAPAAPEAPSVFDVEPEPRREPAAPFELEAFEVEPPPPPPPFLQQEPAFVPPPPPPPPAFFAPEPPPPPPFFAPEPEAPAPPPPPSFFAAEPEAHEALVAPAAFEAPSVVHEVHGIHEVPAPRQPFDEIVPEEAAPFAEPAAFLEPEHVPPVPPPPPDFFAPDASTGPVSPFVAAKAEEGLSSFVPEVAEEPRAEVAEAAAPGAPPAEHAAPAEPAEEIEVEVEPEAAFAEAPASEEAAFGFVAEGAEPAAEAPVAAEEASEPFPEMDQTVPPPGEAEAAPWEEGPVSETPPPPPELAGGPSEGEGVEPITRDLEADLAAFESSGRVRRRPEVWERHAALIGEEIPTDVDLPGVEPSRPAVPPAAEPSPQELEEMAAAARLEDLSKLIPAAPVAAVGTVAAAGAVAAFVPHEAAAPAAPYALTDADVERIARRVVELLSDKAVRDIAWEVVPEYAERLVRERIAEVEKAG